jgi:NAD-dependent deacetylase
LVLALGSTLSVYPAAAIPLEAAERGAPYLILNRGPTDHDDYATLKIDEDVEAIVPSAIRQLVSG